MLEQHELDDLFDELDEKTGQNKPIAAILIWASIILIVLGAIFIFLPLQAQIVIQRLKDKKYIEGRKK